MILRSIQPRAAAVVVALAVGTILAVPCANAGIQDSLANAAAAIGCTTKAVFNPLRVFEWGVKNIEHVTGREIDRESEKPVKEALKECREAAENIVARGFGAEGLVGELRDRADRVQNTVQSARKAFDRIARWFGKNATSPNDRRMALSVSAPERGFYEKETGVLGRKPLPAVRSLAARDEPASLRTGMRPGTGWAAGDDEDARDPWNAADRPDPWGQDAGTRRPEDPDRDAVADGSRPDGGERIDSAYAAALFRALGDSGQGEALEDDYGSALSALERHETEAHRAEAAERLRAVREAELARRQAAREAELARQRAASEAARMQAETAAARRAERQAWLQLGATIAQGVAAIAAVREGHTASDDLPSLPGAGSGAWTPRLPSTPSLPSLPSTSGLPTTEGLFPGRPSYSESTAVPGVGSGSIGGSHGSDCQEDVTPTCRQVAATIESRIAPIRTRLDAGGLSMSQTYDLGAEMYKVFLDHLPACYATETRPHCRALNEQDLQQFRHAYESARESARQARGG